MLLDHLDNCTVVSLPGGTARAGRRFSAAEVPRPDLFSDAGWNLHTPREICTDAFHAKRSPTFRYRTTPLKGLFAHAKGGFYHDGRFQNLLAVVNHYDGCMNLGLSASQKSDLVQYLKSL